MKPKRRLWWGGLSLPALLVAVPVAAITQSLTSPNPATLIESLLVVTVNGVAGDEPVALLRGLGDAFYVPQSVITALRLTRAAAPAFNRGGIQYFLLNAISGLELNFTEAEQTLAITARPEMLERTRLAYPDVALSDKLTGGSGGFVNYDVTAQIASGEKSIAGAFEAGIFSKWGVGTTSFLANWSGDGARLTRLATGWTIDDPANMHSLRLGDGVSGGGPGAAPLRFGGIQLARNFAAQPGFATLPLPSVRGTATVPSVVDIYVNGIRSDSRDVPAGPFQIIDVPVVTGAGEVQLLVRDLLGRETLFNQPYYAAAALLQKGLHDYSYEAGLLRHSFGLKSNDYGAAMISATHRYGFSDTITGELHGVVTKDVQLAGAMAQTVLARLGHIEAALATSRSDGSQGFWGRMGVERRTRSFSFGVNAELSSKDYTFVDPAPGRLAPASVIQAFTGLALRSGSLGLSYLRRDSRGEPDVEFASASTSWRLGGRAGLNVAVRKSLSGYKDFAAQVSLTLARASRANASAGISFADGNFNLMAAYEKYRPVGAGVGYRLATSLGSVDRLEGRLSANTLFGTHDARLTWTDGKTGVRMSTAGGVGLIGGQAFASRPLNQSFGKVKVGRYENVRVYADNQLIGRTGRDGTLILPRLRPFDRNTVRIELADLPWDAEVVGDQRAVRPFDRHGVVVDFHAKQVHAAIIQVLLVAGTPLPAGSTLRLNGGTTDFISAPGGDVYLTGLTARNFAVATWSNGTCLLHFDYPPSRDPQPRIEGVLCTDVRR